MVNKDQKSTTIKNFQISPADKGSSFVQIALLTERIKDLTSHFKVHKKDFHSMRGLLAMVSRRKKLLTYLQRTDSPGYLSLIERLGIRK